MGMREEGDQIECVILGEAHLDPMQSPRGQLGTGNGQLAKRWFPIEHHIQRLVPHHARHHPRPPACGGGGRVQLGGGNVRAEVDQEGAVARARHYRLHAR
jgi:hypothetical protein